MLVKKDEFGIPGLIGPVGQVAAGLPDGPPVTQHDIAMIVHELRNPLIALIGFGRLIAETDDLTRRTEMAQRIESSGAHMLSLINDLLDMAKTGAGRAEIRRTSVNTLRLVADSLSVVESAAAEKGVTLKFDLHFGFPLEFLGDPQRLRQILINLLSNAVKFTDSGMVTLQARVDLVTASMCFSIEDQGRGLSEAEIQTLFQPYYQAPREGAATQGTGLGLTISRNLATLMGGTIRVASMPGTGSTFSLLLPFCARREEEKARRAGAIAPPQPVTTLTVQPVEPGVRPQSCLVVDDNDLVRDVIVNILQRSGHHVDAAASGAVALQMATLRHYDLVLLDRRMKEMDGLETARRLRATPSFDRETKIIGLSAMVTPEDEQAALAAGMNAIFAKTASPLDLIRTITRLILAQAASATEMKGR